MARLPRLTVPGCVHHVIQRGNNRQPIFETDADRVTMLALLAEAGRQAQVDIHAYVLMDNHFHLLLTPKTQEGLSRMMQDIGRRYVRAYNRAHARSGTLWEGRYRSTVIEPEPYLLACMAYMDLNPVRAGLAAQAGDYRWSSYGHYSGMGVDRMLTPHPVFWALGNTPFAREAAYAALVRAGLTTQVVDAITDATLHGWALGSATFRAELEQRTQRRVSRAAAGRPRRSRDGVARGGQA